MIVSTLRPLVLRRTVSAVVALLMLLSLASSAGAKVPQAYQAIAVEAPFSFSERMFDLTEAVALARKEQKPLYIYVGAADCPPCRAYEIFLQQHHAELAAAFGKVVLVDLRTWLRGPDIYIKVDQIRYSLQEFKALVGDKNRSWSYPYFWLLQPTLVKVKQLPRGSANYLSVEQQLEILRIPKTGRTHAPGQPPQPPQDVDESAP